MSYTHTYEPCHKINVHENHVIMSILQKLIMEVILYDEHNKKYIIKWEHYDVNHNRNYIMTSINNQGNYVIA